MIVKEAHCCFKEKVPLGTNSSLYTNLFLALCTTGSPIQLRIFLLFFFANFVGFQKSTDLQNWCRLDKHIQKCLWSTY